MSSGIPPQHCGTEPNFMEFFAHLGDGAVIYGVNGDDIRLVEINSASAEKAGINRHDAIGRKAAEVFVHVESGGLFDVIRRVCQTGTPERFLLKTPQKDGMSRWWENSLFRIAEGQVASVYRETTRERGLERSLQRAGRMEALGTLAGGIAHEFNNVFYTILGYASLAQEDLRDNPTISNLDEIAQAGKRGSNLVKQLLAFSHRAGGERAPASLALAVEQIEGLLHSSLPPGVSLNLELDQRANQIVADIGQVQQLVLNTCLNSFQAMENSGGTVTIELKNTTVRLGRRTSDQWVCLSIQDDGPGMEKTVLDRVFDPFFTTRKPGEGSGLGLAAVLGIVESHGGEAKARSEPGEGTTFDFFFPVETNTSPRSERILFVDDEAMIAQLGKAVLTRSGFEVDSFTDPEEALAAFASTPEEYALVVTDQTMPNMSGQDLAAKIREVRDDTRILLISGAEVVISAGKLEELGIIGQIQKPIDIHDLSSAVESALNALEGVNS